MDRLDIPVFPGVDLTYLDLPVGKYVVIAKVAIHSDDIGAIVGCRITLPAALSQTSKRWPVPRIDSAHAGGLTLLAPLSLSSADQVSVNCYKSSGQTIVVQNLT